MKTIYSLLITVIYVLTTINSATARIINIPIEHETIQAGIDASEDGDTLMVAAGEYVENIDYTGKAITIIGNPDNPEEVIIDGGGEGSVVTIENDENVQSVLAGFTIQNGNNNYGGGIFVDSATLTISDLIIQDNMANQGAGIICGYESELNMSNIIFRNNIAGIGGGLYCHNESRVSLVNCRFELNIAYEDGGGIESYRSDVQLSNVVIICYDDEEEEPITQGEGIMMFNSTGTFNDLIVSNGYAEYGAGISFETNSNVTLNRVILHNNRALYGSGMIMTNESIINANQLTILNNGDENSEMGGGIFMMESELNLVNSIIRGNMAEEDGAEIMQEGGTLTINYCNIIEEGVSGDDPLFIDPENGDFHLTANSPCIDAGDPLADVDPDGTRADIGAFHFHQRDIDVNPIEIHFPAIPWGENDSEQVNVINTGSTVLSIIEFLIPLHVAHVGLTIPRQDEMPIMIEPADTLILMAWNSPDWRVQSSTTFGIVSDDPDEPEIYIYIDAEVMSVEEENRLPIRTELSTAYPNPFNSTVSLHYSLSTPSHTSIQIYDLSGRMIQRLVERRVPAGRFNVSWSADGYSSGMYFVKMETEEFSQIRKIALTR